jgi:hypothetical protein
MSLTFSDHTRSLLPRISVKVMKWKKFQSMFLPALSQVKPPELAAVCLPTLFRSAVAATGEGGWGTVWNRPVLNSTASTGRDADTPELRVNVESQFHLSPDPTCDQHLGIKTSLWYLPCATENNKRKENTHEPKIRSSSRWATSLNQPRSLDNGLVECKSTPGKHCLL